MKKIVFATNNANKLREIREILEGTPVQILSLSDIGCHEDIPEVFDTLEMNSHVKAAYIAVKYGYDCFADDTGLEVDALENRVCTVPAMPKVRITTARPICVSFWPN